MDAHGRLHMSTEFEPLLGEALQGVVGIRRRMPLRHHLQGPGDKDGHEVDDAVCARRVNATARIYCLDRKRTLVRPVYTIRACTSTRLPGGAGE